MNFVDSAQIFLNNNQITFIHFFSLVFCSLLLSSSSLPALQLSTPITSVAPPPPPSSSLPTPVPKKEVSEQGRMKGERMMVMRSWPRCARCRPWGRGGADGGEEPTRCTAVGQVGHLRFNCHFREKKKTKKIKEEKFN